MRNNNKRKIPMRISSKTDGFVSVMEAIFNKAKWFGIPTYGGNLAVFWTIVMLATLSIIEVAAVWKLARLLTKSAGRNVSATLSGSIFYGNALLSLMISWKFVKSWKSSTSYWIRIESRASFLLPNSSIRRKVNFVSLFVAISATVEHILSMISATGADCPPEDYFERYILTSHGFLIHDYEYSLWLAIPIFIMSKSATILWNFQDLIIILMSMGLSSRYHRLNNFVKEVVESENEVLAVKKLATGFHLRVDVWRRIRQAFVQQSALVRKVDTELGALILLSNLNNLYFICLQLFLGIRSIEGTLINRIYYFYSLGWLLLRASSVVLAAAEINLHSQKALPFLSSFPTYAYNIEIKRLISQLNNDQISLNGMGFFALKRQKLLEVAAAIIKYELILIQYDKY
ncbi:gustatory receptor for sugar taste 64a-like [Danaus plexippus]|uniref:gustatory receptor for sugar taste 64a-like n=1 Tax=Danaus plexippus TaxID=13037 RepID=UPI002AB0A26E|nr:gustatory receptor for sugar taste 64a-like [Danaus plexippus]